MTLIELYTRLSETGLPVAYYCFPEGEAPNLPFVCYLVVSSSNFTADGKVYYPVQNIDIELYSKNKDTVSEALIEDALTDIVWEKSETYLDDEKCFEVVYSIQISEGD